MDLLEHDHSYVMRNVDDNSDVKSERVGDDEEWGTSDRRKHRSSKKRKPDNEEADEVLEGSGQKKIYTERNVSCKRSGGSSKAVSDDDDYVGRNELRSKQMKKKAEGTTLEKLSNWYQDGELENKSDGRNKSGIRGHGQEDESGKQKLASKISDHENSRSRSKSKEGNFYDGVVENRTEKECMYSGKREGSHDKVHGTSELPRNHRRRWDAPDAVNKSEDGGHVERGVVRNEKTFIEKHGGDKERNMSVRIEYSEKQNKDLESIGDKAAKVINREDRKTDAERRVSKQKSGDLEEDNKSSPLAFEDRPTKDRNEKLRQQRNTLDRSFSPDEVANTSMRLKELSRRELEHSNRSRTPERSGKRHRESENSEMDSERTSNFKRREYEKEGYREDRSKGRGDGWSEKNRDHEGLRENRKRRQLNEKEAKDRDSVPDHGIKDREFQRHGRERVEVERPQLWSGGRKDGRTEAVKTSSNYGISNENYDVIEIQTKGEEFRTFARKAEAGQQSDVKPASNDLDRTYPHDDRAKRSDLYGSGLSGEDLNDKYTDDNDFQGGRLRGQKGPISGHASGGLSTFHGDPEQGGTFNREMLQGGKGSRVGRGARGRFGGRDAQQVTPLPMIGSPFVPLGMPPPGPMQQPSAPGPPISSNVFLPPFSPPVAWAGARGVNMNVLGVQPSLSPVPPGPGFSPNMGNPSNPGTCFNQPDPRRGMTPSASGAALNAMVLAGCGQHHHDKAPGGWVPFRSSGPSGKAPSRGEQNDYSQNFVDTGMRPQNFIRELELTSVVEDYPKLRELIQRKDEIVAKSASAPMYHKCDLREHVLTAEFFGTKFDVILVDPPWEEYVHRAPGVADHMDYWTFEEILNLKIEAIADTPSFIFLWVGDGVGLKQGRQCLKKWGFRRCEDICWVKTNKTNATPGLRHDSYTLFQHSKEHCLMGIKGTVRRSTDGHIIHANIDTDVIIAEEPPYGSAAKPEDMYKIVEHFSLGRRRLELFGEDHNIRSGWLTIGKELSSSNFNAEAYARNFADKDGKVWVGGGGRNPPLDSAHLVLTTPDIEALRPKSPMKNQQQMQQQTASISLTPPNPPYRSSQEASGSNPSVEGFRGWEGGNSFVSDVLQGYDPAFESHMARRLYE